MAFVYSPLAPNKDSFRLVELQPGRERDVVKLDVKVARLGDRDCDDYEALSYVWGSAKHKVVITVCGHAFPISKALFDCLTALRSPDNPRLLFVDAVCINQADSQEKSHQVKMMRDIYASASLVLAWLGCGDSETDAYMHLAKRISSKDFQPSHSTETELFTIVGWRRGIISPQETVSATSTLHRIMDLPYWKRAWIVQECLVAKEIQFHVGRAATSWDEFLRLHMMLLDKPTVAKGYTWCHLQSTITRFDHLAKERSDFADEYPVSLPRIIRTFCTAESTDPRDMIFAFSGLLQECQPDFPARIRVDYGITAIELYFRAGYAYFSRVKGENRTPPHRVLPFLRQMLCVTSDELLDTICKFIDPETDLWSPVDWIVGKHSERGQQARRFRKERKDESMPYMDCHRKDFARVLAFF